MLNDTTTNPSSTSRRSSMYIEPRVPRKPWIQQHRRRLGRRVAERIPAAEPIAAHEVAQIREPVGAARHVLTEPALAAEPATRGLERPAQQP